LTLGDPGDVLVLQAVVLSPRQDLQEGPFVAVVDRLLDEEPSAAGGEVVDRLALPDRRARVERTLRRRAFVLDAVHPDHPKLLRRDPVLPEVDVVLALKMRRRHDLQSRRGVVSQVLDEDLDGRVGMSDLRVREQDVLGVLVVLRVPGIAVHRVGEELNLKKTATDDRIFRVIHFYYIESKQAVTSKS